MNRLKIGARAHDLVDQTPAVLIAHARQLGLDGLQLAVHKSWPEPYQAHETATLAANIQHLQQAGLSIFLLASYFNPAHSDADFLMRELARVRLNIELARHCHIGVVGSETGSLNDDDWTRHPDNHGATAFHKVEQSLARLRPDLALAGCDFLVEAVCDHIIHDAESLARLNTRLGEHFLVTLDLANLLDADNVADWREILADFLGQHGERIRLLHFKNFILEGRNKVSVGLEQGLIDYAEVLTMLAQCQLTHVPIIVEELSGEALRESVDYLRRLSR
ncbi:sugar phosphate isomerase/epimerase family protein [Aeromonas media]|uniref:sugar phosphate isomerase/epimerase family protein n=1 Tax=Aeromonas media TaxID=651 RepID=UPI0022815A6A|nr:TIM barrel protein [Aeromonas media]MCY9821167.1 TIM barrel protein [Aeromonas media]MCY9837445.1 TIM barrel protein [Aeromonas media]